MTPSSITSTDAGAAGVAAEIEERGGGQADTRLETRALPGGSIAARLAAGATR